MESPARRTARPDHSGRMVRAAMAAATAGAGASLAVPSAAVAVCGDPWVGEMPGNPVSHVYRFSVPPEVMADVTGIEDGQVVV